MNIGFRMTMDEPMKEGGRGERDHPQLSHKTWCSSHAPSTLLVIPKHFLSAFATAYKEEGPSGVRNMGKSKLKLVHHGLSGERERS